MKKDLFKTITSHCEQSATIPRVYSQDRHALLCRTRDDSQVRKWSLLFLILALCSCAPQTATFHPLLNSQPYVLHLSPEPYHVLDKLDSINVTFSQPLDPNTLNNKTVYVAIGEVNKEDVKKEEIPKISGNIESSSDSQSLTWQSSENVVSGDYTLVVTTDVQTSNHASFNQNPGQDPEPFLATFHVAGTDSNASSSSPSPPTPNSSLNRPSSLVLNEVLYDAAGSDTDGNEFIELYGSPGADLDNYQIVIINGSDGEIIDSINIPAHSQIPENGIFLIADAKTNDAHHSNVPSPNLIDNFDPQNGPDAIQLLDDQGHLLDALCYGEGSLPVAHNGLETCKGSPARDVSNGHSLSRVNGIDTQDNNADFVDLSLPTPGVL